MTFRKTHKIMHIPKGFGIFKIGLHLTKLSKLDLSWTRIFLMVLDGVKVVRMTLRKTEIMKTSYQRQIVI